MHAHADALDFVCAGAREDFFLYRGFGALAKREQDDAVAVRSRQIRFVAAGENLGRSGEQR